MQGRRLAARLERGGIGIEFGIDVGNELKALSAA
jgi:hypothetical protein